MGTIEDALCPSQSSRLKIPKKLLGRNSICFTGFCHACYVSCPSQSSGLKNPKNILGRNCVCISGLFHTYYISCLCQFLDLRFLIMLDEYNLCSSALSNFLNSPVISSLPLISFWKLHSQNALNLFPSFKMWDEVWQPCSKTGNIIV